LSGEGAVRLAKRVECEDGRRHCERQGLTSPCGHQRFSHLETSSGMFTLNKGTMLRSGSPSVRLPISKKCRNTSPREPNGAVDKALVGVRAATTRGPTIGSVRNSGYDTDRTNHSACKAHFHGYYLSKLQTLNQTR
jgi:hypothetical protein